MFVQNGLSKEQAVEQARLQCRLAAGEAARCYNLLELRLNRPILDNIIFLGIPGSIQRAGMPARDARRGGLN